MGFVKDCYGTKTKLYLQVTFAFLLWIAFGGLTYATYYLCNWKDNSCTSYTCQYTPISDNVCTLYVASLNSSCYLYDDSDCYGAPQKKCFAKNSKDTDVCGFTTSCERDKQFAGTVFLIFFSTISGLLCIFQNIAVLCVCFYVVHSKEKDNKDPAIPSS